MVKNLEENQAIFYGEEVIAFFTTEGQEVDFESYEPIEYEAEVTRIENTWDIFAKNGEF